MTLRERLARWWLAVRIAFARWLTGWEVCEPEATDEARAVAIRVTILVRHSGHLSWRYKIRRELEQECARLERWLDPQAHQVYPTNPPAIDEDIEGARGAA